MEGKKGHGDGDGGAPPGGGTAPKRKFKPKPQVRKASEIPSGGATIPRVSAARLEPAHSQSRAAGFRGRQGNFQGRGDGKPKSTPMMDKRGLWMPSSLDMMQQRPVSIGESKSASNQKKASRSRTADDASSKSRGGSSISTSQSTGGGKNGGSGGAAGGSSSEIFIRESEEPLSSRMLDEDAAASPQAKSSRERKDFDEDDYLRPMLGTTEDDPPGAGALSIVDLLLNKGGAHSADDFLFVQLPTTLPVPPPPEILQVKEEIEDAQMHIDGGGWEETKGGEDKPSALAAEPAQAGEGKVGAASPPSDKADKEKDERLTENFDPAFGARGLATGKVGKLTVYKSGKIVMRIAGVDFSVTEGQPCHFLQEVARIEHKRRRMKVLGQIATRLICVPNFKALYGASVGEDSSMDSACEQLARVKVKEEATGMVNED